MSVVEHAKALVNSWNSGVGLRYVPPLPKGKPPDYCVPTKLVGDNNGPV